MIILKVVFWDLVIQTEILEEGFVLLAPAQSKYDQLSRAIFQEKVFFQVKSWNVRILPGVNFWPHYKPLKNE